MAADEHHTSRVNAQLDWLPCATVKQSANLGVSAHLFWLCIGQQLDRYCWGTVESTNALACVSVVVLHASKTNSKAVKSKNVTTTALAERLLTCACLRCQCALQGACGHIPLPQQTVLASGEHVLVQWVNHKVKQHAVRQRLNVVCGTAAVATKHPGS
jgi:hypothetical protein